MYPVDPTTAIFFAGARFSGDGRRSESSSSSSSSTAAELGHEFIKDIEGGGGTGEAGGRREGRDGSGRGGAEKKKADHGCCLSVGSARQKRKVGQYE
mmetsp:Transcript_35832/g.106949  ORF Transcript_35832/g.106949 Transcript_35832/m.106949 type:complete len:97 (-) Transcript_35832:159-449(-)